MVKNLLFIFIISLSNQIFGNECLKSLIKHEQMPSPYSWQQLNNMSVDQKVYALVEKINNENLTISHAELDELFGKYPNSKKMYELLTNASTYSQTADYVELVKILRKKVGPKNQVWTSGNVGINSVLGYFNKKIDRMGFNKIDTIRDISKLKEGDAIILDRSIIFQIQSNREVFKTLKGLNIKLIYIDHLTNSLNPAVISHPSQLKKRLVTIFRNNDKEYTKMIKVLKKYRLEEQLDQITKQTKGITNTQQLLKKLNPKMISYEEVTDAIKHLSEKAKLDALDMAITSGHFVSISNLSKRLQNLSLKIQKNALSKGFTHDDVIYVVPEGAKSYQLIAWALSEATKISPNQIRTLKQVTARSIGDKSKMYVFLDDFAGSGDSIVDFSNKITKDLKIDRKNLTIATVFSTEFASTNLKKSNFPNLIEGQIIKTFSDSETFLEAPKAFQKSYLDMNSGGYTSNYFFNQSKGPSSISFEYMSPDNNAKYLSPFSKVYTQYKSGVKVGF